MLVLVAACSADDLGDVEGRSWSTQALTAQADWFVAGDDLEARLGTSVSGGKDVNGDGFADVVVGAGGFGFAGGGRGRAVGYYGSAAGLPTFFDWAVNCPVDDASCDFGRILSIVGDVDADGFDDVAVASFHGGGPVYLYVGSATGLGTTDVWSVDTGQPGTAFSAIGGGDFNGDGSTDIVLGARNYTSGAEFDSGGVFVYDGSPIGLSKVQTWSDAGAQAGAHVGDSVVAVDVDADGFDDLVLGGRDHDGSVEDIGTAWLYRGSASGLDLVPAWTVEGEFEGTGFGARVAGGDVDGDGFDDVFVSAPQWNNGGAGDEKIYFYRGSAIGLATTASWTVEGTQFSNFGGAIAFVPNVNGDAFGDFVIGDSTYTGNESEEGAVLVFLGNATGLDATPAWSVRSNEFEAEFGASVANAGDVTGDGLDDVLAGAPGGSLGVLAVEGVAVMFEGACTGMDLDADGVLDSCDGCPAMADPDQTDTDGDGIGDVCDLCLDADVDGVCADVDCDDADPNVYPGAPELCEGKDTACAGSIPTNELDVDADGIRACDGDCDDGDPLVHPGATEVCNGLDDNCDTMIPPNEVDCDGNTDTDDDEPNDDSDDGGGCSCAVPAGGGGGSVLMIVWCALIMSRRRR